MEIRQGEVVLLATEGMQHVVVDGELFVFKQSVFKAKRCSGCLYIAAEKECTWCIDFDHFKER